MIDNAEQMHARAFRPWSYELVAEMVKDKIEELNRAMETAHHHGIEILVTDKHLVYRGGQWTRTEPFPLFEAELTRKL